MILVEKLKILTRLQKLPSNVGDLGKLIVSKGFKKLPKMQKIAKSGHTDWRLERQIVSRQIDRSPSLHFNTKLLLKAN